ncbi:MAG: outer membrane protein transport protein [Bacteroidota bacterium]|nr:outer membrane protein transport protein [Bacteroidota bacterium]
MKKILSLALLVSTSLSFAGGYRVSLQGNKQLAMGHTGVAVVNSAETMFFNPAGLSFLEDRFNASVGGSYVFSNTKFQNTTYNWLAKTTNSATPLYAYVSYRITDWLTAGLGVYTPYGSTVEWDKDWQGSHLVNKISLSAIYVQPTVAIRVNEYFSFAGGAIFASGGVNFNRNISRMLTDDNGQRSNVDLSASGVTSWGWVAGFMFNLTEDVRLGLNYRSEMTMKARGGEATFANMPAFLGGDVTTTFDADLPLPAELTVGLSYQITDKLLFAFDYNRAKWGAYKGLNVYFGDEAPSPSSMNPRNYKDASTYRLGLQYAATDKFTFRIGWYFDESPIQQGYFAPETPRNDSYGYTGGLSYQINDRFCIDASFLYLHFDEFSGSYNHFTEDGNPNVSFGGVYKNSVFSPGLGLSYNF